ncbi:MULTISPECIES: hypothetical protein [unclassified Carboxylicivirga]|uniref:hypothetical protein n=1 Tax=Carboxylicivirga TaxID=1628153 RepID=UPI003D34577C
MKTIFTKTILIIFIGLICHKTFSQTDAKPEVNVVYGDKHIFTLETPADWINDKKSAQKIGLVCFFYPKAEIGKSKVNYCYAHGIDKKSSEENLEDFIKGDLEKFKMKYPECSFEKIPIDVTGGLKSGVLYSFSNLTDRFKEEVMYSETEDSFIIFSFAAMTEEDYNKYLPAFDGIIGSFNYRGNNPQPFLEYMKSKEQNK